LAQVDTFFFAVSYDFFAHCLVLQHRCLSPSGANGNSLSRSNAKVWHLQAASKFGDAARARDKSQDATISYLVRALPYQMMCDIVHITPALEVAGCTDVLQQAMADITSVDIQPCKEAFCAACMALQARHLALLAWTSAPQRFQLKVFIMVLSPRCT
jgi:hypothetical protein